MSKKAMVDIETLGSSMDAHILSIGIVTFDDEKILERFYYPLGLEDQNRKIELNNLKFWMKESTFYNECFPENPLNLKDVLIRIKDIFKECKSVWANPPGFDTDILRHAYEQVTGEKGTRLVHYRKDMCCRSLHRIYNLRKKKTNIIKNPNKHNALADAKYQALNVIRILKEIGE